MAKGIKPLKCCHPECDICPYVDCRYNSVTATERKLQDDFDREQEAVDPGVRKRRASQKRYEQTEKGKSRQKKYFQSEKGKAVQKRYAQSEKGRANQKRKSKKYIESGKNAERCRAYRLRKKAEREAMNHE